MMTINEADIPAFPEFRLVNIHDREYIQAYLEEYLPYSDFNYLNMYIYEAEVSLLFGNIIIKMSDYLTDEPFVSFIGSRRLIQTVEVLLKYAHEEKITPKLKLVPALSEMKILRKYSRFSTEKDAKNFDYILSTTELSEMKGKKYYDKRKLANRFRKNHTNYSVLHCDLTQKNVQQDILQLFEEWRTQTHRTKSETTQQLIGFKRLLESSHHFKLLPIGIALNDRLIAFSVTELLSKEYAIMHIEKALNRQYPGVLSILKQDVSQRLLVHGYTKMNYTQDLNLPGLLQAKKLWRPVEYLEKITISQQV